MQRPFGKVLPGTRIAWQVDGIHCTGEKMLGPGFCWNMSWIVPAEATTGISRIISYKYVIPPDDAVVEILDDGE